MSNPHLFPRLAREKQPASIREHLDESVAHLRLVAHILSVFHGNPDLGNKTDPVDELIYIILARKTREGAYQQAYTSLKRRFRSWDDLLTTDRAEIERLVYPSGLTAKKTTSIIGALSTLRIQFGSCTLEPVRKWSGEQVEQFLCSLPEVSRKSAYCVMMYALGRAVFPVDAHVGRVLERLGLYRDLGFSLADLNHKVKQALLADAIPPTLRYSLHVNLVAHGRSICKATKPECERCPVNNLCAFFRAKVSATLTASRKPTVVDLFCGAGGLSAGFRQAGFRTIFAVDEDPTAIRTFRLNHPEVPDDRVIRADLRELRKGRFARVKKLLANEAIDVLVGGPPCQGFSRVGWRSRGTGRRYQPTKDDRNHLYRELLGLLRVLAPKVVVMENVPGIGEVRFKDGTSFQDLACTAMTVLGYKVATWTLNATWYGVPQHRIRRVIVGSRLGTPPDRPEPEYRSDADRADHPASEPAITLMEAIGDLPTLGVDDGQWTSLHAPTLSAQRSRYLQRYSTGHPQGLLFAHVTRFQNKRDLLRFRTLRPGDTYMDLITRRPDLQNYRTDAFDDKYFRLRPDAPSRTIVAHLRRDGNSFIHPEQCRSLSVREAARVQSFPDTFIFTGCRGDQFEQIGNAVPPLMAEAIGRVILRHLVQYGARFLIDNARPRTPQSQRVVQKPPARDAGRKR